jgi:hypothetical protein
MSNPESIINTYVNNIQSFTSVLEDLRVLNDMFLQDNTIIDRYFQSPGARTDIIAADVNAVYGAINQILNIYDSGAPPPKASFYKMLP